MDLKTRYVVKGINKEQTIESQIVVHYDEASGKITKLQDRWNGNLPEGSFTEVSFSQLFSVRWWLYYYYCWGFWLWSWTWDTRWWQVGPVSRDATLPG